MAISLRAGSVYSWAELAAQFGFAPRYISVAGGMISRPEHNALLLITHAGGARPNEYEDEWDGDELIYTGRGKIGHQERVGQNRDLGDNARDIYVFEPAGPEELQFLGQATCVDEWPALADDFEGNPRNVLRFRLSFKGGRKRTNRPAPKKPSTRTPSRKPRPFDPEHDPKPPAAAKPQANPEETQALQEKAVTGHQELLKALSKWLAARGWSEIEEIPLAVDLWASMPDGKTRVIFEAKTVRRGSEGPRVRSAIAQLLEYRYLHGEVTDRLCLVCNHAISSRRVELLEHLGISVLWRDGPGFRPGSNHSADLCAGPRAAV